MAGPIKLFQFFQNCQQTIGIDQFEQDQKKRSINSTRMIFLISFAQLMLTMIAFLAFEAESIIDYGFTFWAITCLNNGCGNYSIFIWQSENTLKFIEDCEAFIEKSEFSDQWWEKIHTFCTITPPNYDRNCVKRNTHEFTASICVNLTKCDDLLNQKRYKFINIVKMFCAFSSRNTIYSFNRRIRKIKWKNRTVE